LSITLHFIVRNSSSNAVIIEHFVH